MPSTTRLPRVTDYDFGISAIDANYLRPGLAAIHLMVEGGKAALVDTGTSSSAAGLIEVLRIQNLDPADIAYVFVTHIHLDHAGGAGEFMHRFPNARLVVHPRGARHMADPAKLVASAMSVYGEAEFKRIYGAIRAVDARPDYRGAGRIQPGFQRQAATFPRYPRPCAPPLLHFRQRSQSFFTGDTFGISYREFDVDGMEFVFPTTTPVQFDPMAAHASLERLMGYSPPTLFSPTMAVLAT